MHLFTQDLEILAQRQGSHQWGMVHYFRLPSSLRDGCGARKDAGCKDAERDVDKANALSVALTGRAAGACGGGVVWGADLSLLVMETDLFIIFSRNETLSL